MTKEQHAEYTKRWRLWHRLNGFNADVSDHVDYIANWEDFIEIEESYCSFFGCGHELTLPEKLAGTRCVNHVNKERDIFNCLSV